MKVGELMSRRVFTCSVDDCLDKPAQRMWEEDVGSIPVLDHAGRIAGIVTDRDLCMAAHLRGQPLAAIRVDGVMSRGVVSCRPGEEIAVAQRLMRRHQIHRLPVVEANDRLVGILSLNDLARAAARERTKAVRQIGTDAIAQTLAAITEPRWSRAPSASDDAAEAPAPPGPRRSSRAGQ
jgi:CBS-domain-containing membrane protein